MYNNFDSKSLKNAIDSGKENLKLFNEFISELILKNKEISKLANQNYLMSLNKLTEIYYDLDLNKSTEQLANFFCLVKTISNVINGIFRENILEKEFEGTYNYIFQNQNSINSEENKQKKAKILVQHEMDLAKCSSIIYPDTLQTKNEVPFIDENGNKYLTIMDYVKHFEKIKNSQNHQK